MRYCVRTSRPAALFAQLDVRRAVDMLDQLSRKSLLTDADTVASLHKEIAFVALTQTLDFDLALQHFLSSNVDPLELVALFERVLARDTAAAYEALAASGAGGSASSTLGSSAGSYKGPPPTHLSATSSVGTPTSSSSNAAAPIAPPAGFEPVTVTSVAATGAPLPPPPLTVAPPPLPTAAPPPLPATALASSPASHSPSHLPAVASTHSAPADVTAAIAPPPPPIPLRATHSTEPAPTPPPLPARRVFGGPPPLPPPPSPIPAAGSGTPTGSTASSAPSPAASHGTAWGGLPAPPPPPPLSSAQPASEPPPSPANSAASPPAQPGAGTPPQAPPSSDIECLLQRALRKTPERLADMLERALRTLLQFLERTRRPEAPDTAAQRILDTAQLKLYVHFNQGPALIEFLRSGPTSCALDECRVYLLAHKRYVALGLLYQSKNMYSDALDVWRSLGTGELVEPGSDGVPETVGMSWSTAAFGWWRWVGVRGENMS